MGLKDFKNKESYKGNKPVIKSFYTQRLNDIRPKKIVLNSFNQTGQQIKTYAVVFGDYKKVFETNPEVDSYIKGLKGGFNEDERSRSITGKQRT